MPRALEQRDGRPLVRYTSTRLTFRRNVIELLPPDGWLEIRVRTRAGDEFTVTLTRAEFERDFSNVTRSRSWEEQRHYNSRNFIEAARPYVTHGTPPPPRPARRGQRNTSTSARRVSTLPATDGITNVAEWAAVWSTHAGVPEESAEYLGLVDAWRNAWRPQSVQFLLVAESHMGELSGDARVLVSRPATAPAGLPEGYCRLVHCFGYGEEALCSTPQPRKNSGTIQYWDIFGAVAWGFGHQQPRIPEATFATRLGWKVATLSRLQEMGVWLVDASKAACSGAEGGRRFPRSADYKRVIQESWRRFVWPSVKADAPESVWIIGRGVFSVLNRLPELATAQVMSQPQDRDRQRYLNDLARLASATAQLRESATPMTGCMSPDLAAWFALPPADRARRD